MSMFLVSGSDFVGQAPPDLLFCLSINVILQENRVAQAVPSGLAGLRQQQEAAPCAFLKTVAAYLSGIRASGKSAKPNPESRPPFPPGHWPLTPGPCYGGS